MKIDRRDFLKLIGVGGAVLVLGPRGSSSAAEMKSGQNDFLFVQLSDPHWGFNDPKINPDFAGTLKKAIAAVNDMKMQPDFVVFTGDITHNTDDPKERRKRMSEARDIISGLKVKNVKFMAGEHDAGLDNGEAFSLGLDFYLLHNRKIVNRCDDSVVIPYRGRRFFIRKSRGWVPDGIPVPYTDRILAMGAERNVTSAISKGVVCQCRMR